MPFPSWLWHCQLGVKTTPECKNTSDQKFSNVSLEICVSDRKGVS